MKKLLLAILMAVSVNVHAGMPLTPQNTEAELTKALETKKPIVLKFYADWCGACQKLKPMMAEVEKRLAGKALFYEIDVDSGGPLSSQINAIPTIVVFKERGQAVEPIVGVPNSIDELEKLLLEKMK